MALTIDEKSRYHSRCRDDGDACCVRLETMISINMPYLQGRGHTCLITVDEMNALLVTVLLLATVALARGENCSQNSDCSLTACVAPQHLVCDSNICTCTNGPSGHSCNSKSDCDSNCPPIFNHGHGHFGQRENHCVDGTCHCAVHPDQ